MKKERDVAAVVAAALKKVKGRALTSTQLGTIGEGLVADVLTILSDGEFAVYLPRDDIEGTDMIVKRRHRAADLKVQVKSRESQRDSGAFLLSILARKLPATDPKLIAVINFVPEAPDLELVLWVIPSEAFKRRASFSAKQYQALLSPAPRARDRWVRYRHRVTDLARVFRELLDEAENRVRPTRRGR